MLSLYSSWSHVTEQTTDLEMIFGIAPGRVARKLQGNEQLCRDGIKTACAGPCLQDREDCIFIRYILVAKWDEVKQKSSTENVSLRL